MAAKMGESAESTPNKNITSLAWLADAPMFIDAQQIASFHDAVLQPPTAQGTITISLENLQVDEKTMEASVGARVSFAKWLSTIFPFLDAEINAAVKGGFKKANSKKDSKTITLHPITTPQRQLVQLVLHYMASLPSRLVVVSNIEDPVWRSATFVEQSPRGLVLVDFPPGTKFIPVAAELSNGAVKRLYNQNTMGCKPPTYPEPPEVTGEQLAQRRLEYWNWYRKHFSALGAMTELENAVRISSGNGRIRWVDYRVPIGTGGETVHLHVCGREQYDTGVFAYNLIKRGEKHGLRMVGTVKSEPDINVLAIFEK